ncbi:bifunctional DNA-formamidopyrimidine glycosylase/DNA-(apurinic or apyrimidinic site) lyase [Acidihalobacter prosperus]|uniref:Formamidopyrimidine-DNA glycosylase n=1 Tax=Acidihalobacter prosperus TaxID=160660 RepID=A0A1A6C4B3_9GAMM|nr:bifunctional DNA-formamidopyrimidine glycosylase/DNA-(apurinic or apyrimidinic site) lyase [Acidihalobacter prosperus]OBS09407.1 Formamidopyrimidine-DNA glycosylase [Acidihalobacter prosperus]
MPELPEVETTRRGIAPHLLDRRITDVVVRDARLRWPVPPELGEQLRGQRIGAVERRGKYLLLRTGVGTAILHLGMSGSLRVVPQDSAPARHDHVDIRLAGGMALRLHDPRRFGALLWTVDPPETHPLLKNLGPEPLSDAFDGAYLAACAHGRRTPVKALLMDGRVVVGVGNIYASESLFRAGIDPRRAAGRIAAARHERLAACVREVLVEAIESGGTTLRDFVREDGRPGYFRVNLRVYGRGGEACPQCGAVIRSLVLAQRNTFYCPDCQR